MQGSCLLEARWSWVKLRLYKVAANVSCIGFPGRLSSLMVVGIASSMAAAAGGGDGGVVGV